jgi:RHS repeat-associated protein
VDDGRGGTVSQTFSVNVVTQLTDQPPAIVTTPPLAATVGRQYTYNAQATDPDNDPLMWSFDKAPPGMSVDRQLGTIRWTPTADEVGAQTAVLRVNDGQGGFAVQNIPVIVRSVDVPPVITSTPPTEAAVGLAYTYQVQASNAEHDPLLFSLPAAPAAMTINATSGLIQWTPTTAEVGPQTVTVQADDGQGGVAVQTYTVVVSATPPDQPPVITSMPTRTAIAATLYQYQVTASEPENQGVQFALAAAPAGMTIDATSGLVQWTPSPAQAGQAGGVPQVEPVTVTATDPGGNAASQRFVLTVRAVNHPPAITSAPVTTVLPGALYSYDVQASDPDGDPLTYHLDTAPQGMTVDAQGRIRWSPAAADLGDQPVALTVSDGLGGTAAQSFTVTVGPDTEPPRVSVQVNPNPVDIGAPATVVVSATDNVGVQMLGLAVNGMQVALDSNGQGSVTMSQAGQFDVVATATDAAGNTGKATASLLVIDPHVTGAPTVTLPALPAGAVITSPTDITGTVNDPNLLSYTLAVAPADGTSPFVSIGGGTAPVTNGVLGQLDPTMLSNDNYVLRLTATNAGGNTSTAQTAFSVAGNLKLGNFTLSFTDLTVPVSGIPITLTRTYDTLQAGASRDIGYGWRLAFRQADVHTSLPKTGEEANGIFNGLRDGTRVYVTLPGGKREGFTFCPVSEFVGDAIFQPSFCGDPGVTDQLTVQGETGNQGELSLFENIAGQNGAITISHGPDGGYVGTNDGTPYNPADDVYGSVYFLTTKDGTVYQINALSGQLDNVTDRNGNTLTFTDAGITSSAGPAIAFGRDPQGRIVSVTDPPGQSIAYQYDANGDLIAVTNGLGNTTRFVYSTARPHYLDQVIDPLGHTGVRSDYDSQGRLIGVTNADGQTVHLTQDLAADTETVLDARGNPTVFQYDDQGNIVTQTDALGGVTHRTFDTNNNLLTETDPVGNTTSRTYDNSGNLLTLTDPLGNISRFTYDIGNRLLTQTNAMGNTITTTYDSSGSPLTVTPPTGASLLATYDASGNRTSITYPDGGTFTSAFDAAGREIRRVDPLGNSTQWTYDANGNQLTMIVSRTINGSLEILKSVYAYDAQNRLVATTDPLGGVTRTEYNALGQITARVDPLGMRTTYSYDPAGHLTKTTYPDGSFTSADYDAAGNKIHEANQAGQVTTFVYDALNRLITTILPDETPADMSDNPRTQTEYDVAGHVTAQIDAMGNRTDFTYDKAGQRIKTLEPAVVDPVQNVQIRPEVDAVYDAVGDRVVLVDAKGQRTQFFFDAQRRLTRTVFADGTSTETVLDGMGQILASTDQAGQTTQFAYDALGHLLSVTLPPPAAGQAPLVTSYTYDEAGNRISQTDALGRVTRFGYDELGREVQHVLPMGQVESFTYDADGNEISHTDFNSATTTFEYDMMMRLEEKIYPDGSTVAFTYTPTGQRQTVVDAQGTTTYAYDAADRLVSRTDPDGRTIAYTYDANGNRTSVTIPSGTTSYAFDALNRLVTVTDPTQGVTRYSYDLAGNLTRSEFPNSAVETRQYDSLNRLVFLQNTGPGGVLSSYQYTLSPSGLRTSVTEDTGRHVTYTYDNDDRLITEQIVDPTADTRIIAYTYDPVGNRLTRSDSIDGLITYTYDANDRLLTDDSAGATTSYTYDNNGNLVSQNKSPTDQVINHWDYENHLIGTDMNNSTGMQHVDYRYNADGIRVAEVVAGQETRFLVDANRSFAEVLEEYVPGAGTTVSYVYGNNLISQTRAGQQMFFLVDALGSTRLLTSATGVVTDRYTYDSFGQLVAHTGPTVNDYLFQGEQLDPNLGFYYLRARYDDVSTGRFLSADPYAGSAVRPDTLQRYLYAGNDPVNKVDPSGKFGLLDVSITIGIIAGLTAGAVTYYKTNSLLLAAGVGITVGVTFFFTALFVGAFLSPTAVAGGAATGGGVLGNPAVQEELAEGAPRAVEELTELYQTWVRLGGGVLDSPGAQAIRTILTRSITTPEGRATICLLKLAVPALPSLLPSIVGSGASYFLSPATTYGLGPTYDFTRTMEDALTFFPDIVCR